MCIFRDGGLRHLGFVIRQFWTTRDVPVAGFYVTCQWRNDQLEFIRDIIILPFRDFGWKMPIPANEVLGDFDPLKRWRHHFNSRRNAAPAEPRILTYRA